MRHRNADPGVQEQALQVLLSNPYKDKVRRQRRDLERTGVLPPPTASAADWRGFWAALPPSLGKDEGAALAVCVGATSTENTSLDERALVGRIREVVSPLPKRLEAPVAELAYRRAQVEAALNGIIGETEIMEAMRRDAWAAAFGERLDYLDGLLPLLRSTPVLILGETGTGKERVAQALCLSMPGRWTARGWQPAPHESVNLAAGAPSLVYATLFGHEKGAFTGAERRQTGVLKRCHAGVVFLDEVAELPMDAQVALLRSLQEGKVRPLGATEDTDAAPRILSATHDDLGRRVVEGRFREDLYHRLHSVVIQVPPLRERRTDILPIAEAELRKTAPWMRSGLMARLQTFLQQLPGDYPWPGNVRELCMCIRTLALGLEPRRIQSPVRAEEALPPELLAGTWPLDETRRWYAQRVRNNALSHEAAARTLGIDPGTLRRLLELPKKTKEPQ